MSMQLRNLIELYRTDPYSWYAKLKYPVRVKQDRLLARIEREHGSAKLQTIRTRTLLVWYSEWLDGGKIAMAHSLMSCLRQLLRFGAGFLEDTDCLRLHDTIRKMRFQRPARRTPQMSRDQALSIIMKAHEFGWHSIALAQAIQFELSLAQKDVIGEWVPISEAGESDVAFRGQKWLRGLRWSHIDENLILNFVTGKGSRSVQVDLKTAPMIIEIFSFLGGRKQDGPAIVNEGTGMPWANSEFRRKWRILADAAGLPKEVRNADSKPNGLIIGDPDRASVSRKYTSRDVYGAVRTLTE